MTATQEPLFPPGWEQEPDADERAFVDLHGPQQPTSTARDVETVDVVGTGRWL